VRWLLYFAAVLTFRSVGPGGRSEGICRRPARASGRTVWFEEAPGRSEQHETASTMGSTLRLLLFERSHMRGGEHALVDAERRVCAHVFLPGDGVGRPRRVSQLRSLLVKALRSTCAVRLLVVDDLAAA
jgi:hypothetical protein